MKRGICGHCHQTVKLTRKGLTKPHVHPFVDGRYRCHGSKQAPRVIIAERLASLSPLSPQRHSGSGLGVWL